MENYIDVELHSAIIWTMEWYWNTYFSAMDLKLLIAVLFAEKLEKYWNIVNVENVSLT